MENEFMKDLMVVQTKSCSINLHFPAAQPEHGICDVVNDPSAPQSANVQSGLMSCPDQSNLGWQGSVGTFSGPGCISPPKATTCDEEHDKNVLTQSSSGFTQCKIQTVMENFLKKPLEDFIRKLQQDAHQGKNTFDPAEINELWQFNHAFTAWQDLTRGVWQSDPTFASGGFYKDVCGFDGVSQETRQYKVVTDCTNLCDDIKAAKSDSSGENIKAALEEFLFFTLSNFTPSTNPADPYNGMTNGQTCEARREKLYERIGAFEKFLPNVEKNPAGTRLNNFPDKYRYLI